MGLSASWDLRSAAAGPHPSTQCCRQRLCAAGGYPRQQVRISIQLGFHFPRQGELCSCSEGNNAACSALHLYPEYLRRFVCCLKSVTEWIWLEKIREQNKNGWNQTFWGILFFSQTKLPAWLSSDVKSSEGSSRGWASRETRKLCLRSELLPKTAFEATAGAAIWATKFSLTQFVFQTRQWYHRVRFSVFEFSGMNLGLHFSPSKILSSH